MSSHQDDLNLHYNQNYKPNNHYDIYPLNYISNTLYLYFFDTIVFEPKWY